MLEEHGRIELGQQFGPARQAVLAHAHHAGLGDGRFGQGREHGGGHAGRCAIAFEAVGVVHGDAVAATGQCQCQQPAHEAAAQNGDAGRSL